MLSKVISIRLVSALFLVVSAIALEAQMQSPTALASLAGVVTNRISGLPIGDVLLTLTPQTGTPVSVASGASGAFVAESLYPGRYAISLSRDGFYQLPRSGAADIILAPGQVLEGMAFEMAPTSAITGRVFDERGEAKGGIIVVAFRPEYRNGRRVVDPGAVPASQRAETNELGEYRLWDLQAGEYYLGTVNLTPEYYPGVSDLADAVPIRVSMGLDMPAMHLQLRRQELYSVSFRILEPLRDPNRVIYPNTHQMIQLVRRSRNGIDVTVALRAVAQVGGPGHRFQPIAEGGFISPGLLPGSYEFFYAPQLPANGQVGRLAFDIVDRGLDAGTIVVKPSATIQGRIIWGTLPARVDSGPVRVSLRSLNGENQSVFNVIGGPIVSINDDGRFVFPHVAEGHFLVSVTGLPSNIFVASVRYAGREVRDTGFFVDGDIAGPLEIFLDGPGGLVTGIVRDSRDLRVSNSIVTLVPAPDRRTNSNLFKTAVTDQLGAFSMSGIPPGSYGVLAFEDIEPGAHQNAEFLKGFESQAVQVNVQNSSLATVNIYVIPIGN